jgi:phosphocarrier protein
VAPEQTTHSTTVTILNRLGLHARPAMSFVDAANAFDAEIRVSKGAQSVDGKSIMQMMMLAATKGTVLTVEASGSDAQEALAALTALVHRKFDEE